MQREIKSGTGIRREHLLSVGDRRVQQLTQQHDDFRAGIERQGQGLPCFFGLQYDVNPPRMVRHRCDASIEDFGSHVLPAK